MNADVDRGDPSLLLMLDASATSKRSRHGDDGWTWLCRQDWYPFRSPDQEGQSSRLQ